jgi:hypothetical protein
MKSKMRYKVRSKVWLYPGMDAWHFLTVSEKQSEEIKKSFQGKTRGWGSLPVEVTLGKTKWKTSIFPDKKSGTFLLPLKAEVRRKEGVARGDTVTFIVDIQA